MKTSNENQNAPLRPKCTPERKRVRSKLDPFTEPLLQMDMEKKSLQDMLDWLKTQNIETVASNLSVFLAGRRTKRQLDQEKNAVEAFQEWWRENPHPKLKEVMERFKMLALSLSLQPEAAPEVLKLADKLAGTASRTDYRERKLLMEEAKHAEWVKCEETRALELCLEEAKKYPEIADMYRGAFDALRARRKQENGV